ncbi:Acyl-CoA-binding domain-containing protein 5 [Apostasia shenzhenica]|uniref:Acyl-CoA-binding domain-containing protein 5 n=1 Tax=Apostasia shenzhenica TaxID=1088818 RepID=A0A2I0A0J1_9ASPA|nr:Acyl-CoA-binding domain-containing protein 5 [Apostasia shenzhenica]
MFVGKSSTWLPFNYKGTGPSSRSNQVAALNFDRYLFEFGRQSKSGICDDICSLYFETMVWSKIRIKHYHLSPGAGGCSILCRNNWYIVRGRTTGRGFSLVPVHHKYKLFIVVFKGRRREPSNENEILIMENYDNPISWRFEDSLGTTNVLAVHLYGDGIASSIRRHIRQAWSHGWGFHSPGCYQDNVEARSSRPFSYTKMMYNSFGMNCYLSRWNRIILLGKNNNCLYITITSGNFKKSFRSTAKYIQDLASVREFEGNFNGTSKMAYDQANDTTIIILAHGFGVTVYYDQLDFMVDKKHMIHCDLELGECFI